MTENRREYDVVRSDTADRLSDRLLVGSFLVWLALPGILGLAGVEVLPEIDENRAEKRIPRVPRDLSGWRSWSMATAEAFEDSVGLRSTIVQLRSLVYSEILGDSPNDRVLKGREGWWFLAGRNKIDYFHRLRPLGRAGVARWISQLTRNREFLESHGAQYVVLVAPNKETVYPQYMPRGFRVLNSVSRAEQIGEAAQESGLSFVNPAAALRAEQGQSYAKTDVHWNGLGAFVAYSEVMGALVERYPDLQAVSRTELEPYEVEGAFDLMRQAGLEMISTETWDMLRPRDGWAAQTSARSRHPIRGLTREGQPFQSRYDRGYPLRVLVLHDSFGQFLKPYFAESFQETNFLHHRYYSSARVDGETMAQILGRLRPDVVVHVTTERVFAFGARAFPDYSATRRRE